ncbi:MAG: hypothetical protein ACREIU_00025, partial [Planctomycetota bacterium]
PTTPEGLPLPGVHPIQVLFQGAPGNSADQPVPAFATQWVSTLDGLNQTSPRFVRFAVLFDQTLATSGPPPNLLAVLEVKLFLNAE